MVCNVGGVDRIVRVLVGIVLAGVALYFFPLGITKVVLLTVAASSLATAWFGFCFINKFFGVNTARRETVKS